MQMIRRVSAILLVTVAAASAWWIVAPPAVSPTSQTSPVPVSAPPPITVNSAKPAEPVKSVKSAKPEEPLEITLTDEDEDGDGEPDSNDRKPFVEGIRTRQMQGGGQERTSQDLAPVRGPATRRNDIIVRAGGSFVGDLRALPQGPVRKRERPEFEGPPVRIQKQGGAVGATPTPDRSTVLPAFSAPAPGPTSSFEGLDYANWGSGFPPDTNGDVGPTHFIQTVNASVGIYNKSTGVRLTAFTFDTLMSQGTFGNICDTENFGDPVVVYDTFEDRWVLSDFAFQLDGSGNVLASPGVFECFAVSKTGDPVAGGWNFYSFNTTGAFGDYPKLGVWPDGLYISFNMFTYGGSYLNPRVYALNKAQMYAGSPTVQIVGFDVSNAEFSLLPANARLQTGTPPAGSPNYLISNSGTDWALDVFKFHVDWSNLALSTLTGPTVVVMPSYTVQSTGTVPSPANVLDTLRERLMMQNQYSNISGVESLWNVVTVGAAAGTPAQAAVRYFQVKVTGGAVEANASQAYTHSPDTTNRMMPSVAVNRLGDMAIGYNATSAALNPAIRYAGRLAADPINSLPLTETSLIAGGGSQSGNCGGAACTRWGDYSALTLDPDGCKFWFTGEYYQTTGLSWNTRIGAFSFPGCTANTNGTLSGYVYGPGVVPISGATVQLGARTTTTNGSGFYSFSGLPAGTYPSATGSASGFNAVTVASLVVPGGGTKSQNFTLTAAPASGCFADTTQADFQAGAPINCDLTSTPGSVILANQVNIDQQNTSGGNIGTGSITNTSWAAQTFTTGVAGTLVKVDFQLFCNACTSNPNLVVSIRATSSGLPTGADLASATIAGNNAASATTFTATFISPPTLTASTVYALVVRTASAPGGSGYFWIRSSPSTYAAGQRTSSADSGTVWTADSTRDYNFHTYMYAGYAPNGSLESSVKDANPLPGYTVAWGTINWTASVPGGSTLKVQVAASNSVYGPFTFVGPDGTAATFFSSGASLSQFNGKRYVKYRVTMTSATGAVTPTLNDVTLCFSMSPPSAFTKVAPANTATAQPASTVLTWNASAGAASYEYCIDTSANGACNTSWVSTGTATSVTVSGLPASTLHSWHVRAINSGGTTYSEGAPGTFWSFTTGTPAAPFGQVDTPVQNAAGVQGAIAVTGWSLDDVGVTKVEVFRNCLGFEPANCQSVLGNSVVYVGQAAFLSGARPDVAAAFPTYPQSGRAGWGYLMLTPMLPHVPNSQPYGGQGALTLYMVATDTLGNQTLLGRNSADHTATSITMTNATIAKPFGAIDTPGQGQTIGGVFNNFGWAITPDLNTVADGTDIVIPTNGSTMTVFIDGLPVSLVSYNQCRGTVGNPVPGGVYCNDDVSNIFGNLTPQASLTTRLSNPTLFRNLDATRAPIGAYTFDTSTLTNGLHTIAWSVTDSNGRNEGIGSRFFTVLNGAPGTVPEEMLLSAPSKVVGPVSQLERVTPTAEGVWGRTGFDLSAPWQALHQSETGRFEVRLPELGRLELWLGAPIEEAYLLAEGTLRPLPVGTSLSDAQFAWMPPPGYVGSYDLAFIRGTERIDVTVTVVPKAPVRPGDAQIRMHLDHVDQSATPTGPLVSVSGWAFDPQSALGSGIGAVQVWATKADDSSAVPFFVGSATLDQERLDVPSGTPGAPTHAGFVLTAAVPPGAYNLTAYAWNERTARWEDARTVSIVVR